MNLQIRMPASKSKSLPKFMAGFQMLGIILQIPGVSKPIALSAATEKRTHCVRQAQLKI